MTFSLSEQMEQLYISQTLYGGHQRHIVVTNQCEETSALVLLMVAEI